MISRLIYNISVGVYTLGIRLAAPFNQKARHWVDGRRGWQENLRHAGLQHTKNVWMHCASLGEFEQGRPVLEALKKVEPELKVVLTFFSPSGYETRKNYAGADVVMYLPTESPKNVGEFLRLAKPILVLWVKYEYWFEYLKEISRRKIPLLLISAKFREGQPFFKPYGSLWREMLEMFTFIFVQDVKSMELLKSLGAKRFQVVGDTRFDRVVELAETPAALPDLVENFCRDSLVLVAGSTWEDDDLLLAHLAKTRKEIKFVVAPHEVDAAHMASVQKMYPTAQLFSQVQEKTSTNILIIDNIGMLNKLYRLANICYIGGGFNDSGIHNCLEAAVYAKPVVFGPGFGKFAEAVELVEIGGAKSVSTALELEEFVERLARDTVAMQQMGEVAGAYVQRKTGATARILDYITENRLLTN